VIIKKFDKCQQRGENKQNDTVTAGTITIVPLAATALIINVTCLLLKHMISLQNFIPLGHKQIKTLAIKREPFITSGSKS